MSKLPVYFVGLGIFGTSIAQVFQRQGHPVKGYDNGDDAAASRGVNVRTIRGDYPDPEELRIAYDCRNNWEEEQKQYFTKPGRWVAYHHDDPTIENINKARKSMGFEERPINSPEALDRLRRVFGLDIVAKNGKVVLNEDDGLIDLDKILQDARTSIPHQKTNVQKLIYNPDLKKITGIEVSGGECVNTSEAFVFITAGAWTPKLLHDAGIPYTREIPRAVGLFSFPVHLTKEHASKLKGEPALSLIGDGQFTAPLGDKLIGWVTWIKRPFLVHDPSDKSIDYSVSHYAARAKLEVWRWLQLSPDFHGEQIGLPQYNFDGVTSDQRHQIFRLGDLNAIVATNGSWHGAKKAMEIARHAMKVFKGEKSIYESGEEVEHPHQPRLNTEEQFVNLDMAAAQEELVTELYPFVQQPWPIVKSVQELRERIVS